MDAISTMPLVYYASAISLGLGLIFVITALIWLHRIDKENRRIPATQNSFSRFLTRVRLWH